MAKKRHNPNPAGRKGKPITAAPLTMDQLVDGVFQIKSSDVKRIVAGKPGKGKKS
jgi:hypothetical protein